MMRGDGGNTDMAVYWQRAQFWIILLVAAGLASWAMLPPSPRTTTTNSGFALTRALDDLRTITRAPHPTGSAENARVRDILVARLRGIGLTTEIQRGTAVRQTPRAPHPIAIAPVENIIAVLPGRDRAAPALAVMAHYDSVPFSFGASDDGAGVVAVLETARALIAGPQPQRDVVFLLTDGEELGLLGAQMFFDDHPLARRIGMVVNAEARGSRGRASMFQTSPGNAALVDLWADNAISPTGNSVSSAIYRRLPNDTDLSVSLANNIAGINGSYIGGHFDYHSTTDSFATINRGALQHLGDFTLTTALALAMADALPATDRDASYFDVLGQFVVRYPPWLGWLPLLLAGAGLVMLYRREEGVSWRRALGGFGGIVGATVALAAAGHGIGMLKLGSGAARMREVMAEIDIMIWAMAALVLAALLLLRAGRGLRLGALVMLWLIGFAAQIWLPGAAFLFAWPVLLGVVLLVVEAQPWGRHPVAIAVLAILTIITLAVVFQLLGFFYIAVGLLSAGVLALALPMLAALLPDPPHFARLSGAVVLVAALGVIGWTAASDGFSPRQPRPGDFFALYAVDEGRALWATTSDARYLPPGEATRFTYPPFARRPIITVPAPALAVPAISERLAITETTADGRQQWDIAIPRAPRLVTLAFRPDQPLRDVRVNGRAVSMPAGEWTQLYYRVGRTFAMNVSAVAPANARVAIRYSVATSGLPATPAPRDSGLVTNWTPFSGGEVMVGEWRRPPPSREIAR